MVCQHGGDAKVPSQWGFQTAGEGLEMGTFGEVHAGPDALQYQFSMSKPRSRLVSRNSGFRNCFFKVSGYLNVEVEGGALEL